MLPICIMSYLMLERTAKEMVHVTGISSVTAVNGAAYKVHDWFQSTKWFLWKEDCFHMHCFIYSKIGVYIHHNGSTTANGDVKQTV